MLAALQARKNSLKKIDDKDKKDRSSANTDLAHPQALKEECERYEYYFDSGANTWMAALGEHTFSSSFACLSEEDAKIMVDHWLMRQHVISAKSRGTSGGHSVETLLDEVVQKLASLVQRFEEAILAECAKSSAGLAFVKLSTRSPKDSPLAFEKGVEAYRRRVEGMSTQPDWNTRFHILQEEIGKAGAVSSGIAAVRLLCDSERIYEDLEYALRPPRKAAGVVCRWNVQVVARSWDPRVTMSSEFRGIVWGFKLTCLGQYFHQIYFAKLRHQSRQIEEDCRTCFETVVQPMLSALGGNCIVDFSWMGAKEVRIIEINPFDGDTFGTFSASTGLFSWEDTEDKELMQGNRPFQLRLREAPLTLEELEKFSDQRSRNIIFQH